MTLTLFSQSTLISKLCLKYFEELKEILYSEKEKLPPLMFSCCVLHEKDLFPASLYIVCASTAEPSFTVAVSLCAALVS